MISMHKRRIGDAFRTVIPVRAIQTFVANSGDILEPVLEGGDKLAARHNFH